LSNGDEVLKQDERGRMRVSRERREALLAEFEKSGMSGAKFARLAGLNYQTFAGWTRRRKSSGANESPGHGAGTGMVQFLQAVVGGREGASKTAGGLQVELPGGCRLRIEAPGQLALAAELIALIAQSGRARC
jgi:transposase-like protein